MEECSSLLGGVKGDLDQSSNSTLFLSTDFHSLHRPAVASTQ